jgi:hypothetical protein
MVGRKKFKSLETFSKKFKYPTLWAPILIPRFTLNGQEVDGECIAKFSSPTRIV